MKGQYRKWKTKLWSSVKNEKLVPRLEYQEGVYTSSECNPTVTMVG